MRIVWLIVDIALLRRGPQALPASQPITIALLACYAMAGVLVQLRIAPDLPPLPPVLFDLALTVGLVSLVLWARNCLQRFLQTLAAVAGTGALLTLCGLPMVEMLGVGGEGSALAMVGVLLWLGLISWSLLVTAHILRHAIEVNLSVGLLLAVFFLAASVLLYGVLFDTAQ